LCYSFNQMRAYKNRNGGLIVLTSLVLGLAFAFFSFSHPNKASADTASDANAFCKTAEPFNGKNPDGSTTTASNAQYTACKGGYAEEINNPSIGKTSYCNTTFSGIQSTACVTGWNGAANNQTTAPSGTNYINNICNAYSGDKLSQCVDVLSTTCNGWTNKTAQNPDPTKTLKSCLDGAQKKLAGQSNSCDSSYNGAEQTACDGGFNNTTVSNASGSNNGSDTSDCVVQGSTTLEWILCPLTTALGKTTDAMNGFIENQLDFSARQMLPDSNCKPSGSQDCGVYKAWTIFKNLVTSVLVVVLLIVVISQAAGTSVFEAYTVRKVLPRLVIAVIAMQISWQLCIFMVGIANDLGNGLANLITAPFGGAGNMDLNSILNHLSPVAAIGTNVGIAAALTAGFFIAVSNPAGALLIAFSIILSVLIALATILFRNIIIIVCIMLSPLAFLLWCMPMKGVQSYWNLWRDNFTKALLLFPLMVAIIYGGRIFAWIVGGLDGPGFIDFIMVLVGFFGPYYYLPKAFGQGGKIMSQGANMINKGGNALGKKPKEYLKGRSEEFGKLRKQQSQRRVSEGNPQWWKGDKFRSGEWDPVYRIGGAGKTLREAHAAHYEAAGASSFEEENKQFESSIEAREKGLNERFRTVYAKKGGGTTENGDEAERDENNRRIVLKTGDKDLLNQAIVRGDSSIKFQTVDGKSLTIDEMFGHVSGEHKEAALGRLATLGGNPNLTDLNSQVMNMMERAGDEKNVPAEERAEINRQLNRFLGRYASSMFGKMPHWYKGIGGAASGLSPEALSGVSGASMEQMLSSLRKDIDSDDPKKSQLAAKDLSTLLRTWGEAVANPNIAARIDKSAAQRLSDVLLPKLRKDGTIDKPAEIDAIADKVIANAGDLDVQNDTRDTIATLKSRVTRTGDIRRQGQEGESPQQGATSGTDTSAKQSNTDTNANNTGEQQGQGRPQGDGGGGNGGGEQGAGGSTYTPPQPTGGLGKTTMKEAFKEAIEETGLNQRRGGFQGEMKVQHGPEIMGQGTPFEGSMIYQPQERRARPPENDNQPPNTPPPSV